MPDLFLDPLLPLSTCKGKSCFDCPVRAELTCHFGALQLLRFFAVVLPAGVAGGIGIARINSWFLMLWIVACVSFFGFAEIRALCAHCPHYAEPGISSLRCWANFGSPKLWRYRPGPMTGPDKAVFWGGISFIAVYPLAVLLVGGQWALLGVYGVLLAATAFMMKTFMCRRCMNFACPLNSVPPAVRSAFFGRNPSIAHAWNPRRGREEKDV
jgi:hypothetical protein